MKLLTVIPTQPELALFLQACRGQGYTAEETTTGKISTAYLRNLDITVASGGLGKVQFAVQTEHLIDSAQYDLVVCAGGAGALASGLAIGDVVIATETVEHDIRNLFGPPHLPRFPGAKEWVERCRRGLGSRPGFRVHFGPIASGDEDVTDRLRREALRKKTGALVVAWEGAGGARACKFSGVPFIEIRGVTDSADSLAALAFLWNLKRSMKHVASVVTRLPGL